jgi:hypothetical protein
MIEVLSQGSSVIAISSKPGAGANPAPVALPRRS